MSSFIKEIEKEYVINPGILKNVVVESLFFDCSHLKHQLIDEAPNIFKGFVFEKHKKGTKSRVESYADILVEDLTQFYIRAVSSWEGMDRITCKLQAYLRDDIAVVDEEDGQKVKIYLTTTEVVDNILGKFDNLPYFRELQEFITEGGWNMFEIVKVDDTVLIRKKVDYRYYRCNEVLWDMLEAEKQQKIADNLPKDS